MHSSIFRMDAHKNIFQEGPDKSIRKPNCFSKIDFTRKISEVEAMNIDTIREVLNAKPFRAFWIHTADGSRIPVEHEEFVALDPSGMEMMVYLPDRRHQYVDMALITRLEIKPKNGRIFS